jgi:hypothetical protein
MRIQATVLANDRAVADVAVRTNDSARSDPRAAFDNSEGLDDHIRAYLDIAGNYGRRMNAWFESNWRGREDLKQPGKGLGRIIHPNPSRRNLFGKTMRHQHRRGPRFSQGLQIFGISEKGKIALVRIIKRGDTQNGFFVIFRSHPAANTLCGLAKPQRVQLAAEDGLGASLLRIVMISLLKSRSARE